MGPAQSRSRPQRSSGKPGLGTEWSPMLRLPLTGTGVTSQLTPEKLPRHAHTPRPQIRREPDPTGHQLDRGGLRRGRDAHPSLLFRRLSEVISAAPGLPEEAQGRRMGLPEHGTGRAQGEGSFKPALGAAEELARNAAADCRRRRFRLCQAPRNEEPHA